MSWPIYVLSKGRAAGCATFHTLYNDGLEPHVVVEPAELMAYAEHIPITSLVALPENNRGIVYVRNYILEHAKATGSWVWMMDDDVTGFYETNVGTSKAVPASAGRVLGAAERLIRQRDDVALAALEYRQFSWSASKPYTLNSYCDVVVAMNGKRMYGLSYDQEQRLKQDRDMALQVMRKGFKTMRLSALSFATPTNGTNDGGLKGTYKAGLEADMAKRLVAKWGSGIVEFVHKPNGRPDAKINWRAAAKKFGVS